MIQITMTVKTEAADGAVDPLQDVLTRRLCEVAIDDEDRAERSVLRGYDFECDRCGRAWFSRDEGECFCNQCGGPAHGEPAFTHFAKIEQRVVRCLLCGAEIGSAYLDSAIPDDRVYLLACMVTHYRHHHVKYYNNSVGYVQRHTSVPYEAFKSEVNERAKRQIIRKATANLRALGITAEHFEALQNSEPKTIALARKLLGSAAAEAGSED